MAIAGGERRAGHGGGAAPYLHAGGIAGIWKTRRGPPGSRAAAYVQSVLFSMYSDRG